MHLSLPPRRKPMLHLAMRNELLSMRVHCSVAGCAWSCPCRDADDAVEILGHHLTWEHQQQPERAS